MRTSRFLTSAVAVTTVAAILAAPVSAFGAPPGDAVQRGLDAVVHVDGFPGALAAVRGADGRTRDYTSGSHVPVDGQVRIGSNTKPFVSVVVLQLVGEGKVDLDAPVETYLPTLLRGDGIDGRHITVREILQHTSGLPDYVNVIAGAPLATFRHTYLEPRELIDRALTLPADFAPGAGWEYSNTNYVVAGLIVQKVTGRPLGEEVTDRVIRRAGLKHTYFPAVGEQALRGPHPHGYDAATPGGKLTDVTVLDPDWAWAAGAMVATPSDVNKFFGALLAGRLLAPAQLAEMRRTVPAPDLWPGARYGLGLASTPLSCGGLAWGHGGDIFGYETRDLVTEDGRAATVAVTALPSSMAEPEKSAADVEALVDKALCA